MSKLVTENFKIEMAKKFYDALDIGFNASLPPSKQNYFYAVLGRQLNWPDEQNPPAPTQGTNCLNQLFRNALFAKRLSNAESSFVTRRIDWQSGTVYDMFDDSSAVTLDQLNFYVVTDDFNVYKCIDNIRHSLLFLVV